MGSHDHDDAMNDPYFVLSAIILIYFLGTYLWETLSNWDTLHGVYRYVALYYYSLVVWPLSGNSDVWDFMRRLTPFDHLNYVLALLGCAMYSLFVVGLLGTLSAFIDSVTRAGTGAALFAMPGMLLIPWWMLAWLFS